MFNRNGQTNHNSVYSVGFEWCVFCIYTFIAKLVVVNWRLCFPYCFFFLWRFVFIFETDKETIFTKIYFYKHDILGFNKTTKTFRNVREKHGWWKCVVISNNKKCRGKRFLCPLLLLFFYTGFKNHAQVFWIQTSPSI